MLPRIFITGSVPALRIIFLLVKLNVPLFFLLYQLKFSLPFQSPQPFLPPHPYFSLHCFLVVPCLYYQLSFILSDLLYYILSFFSQNLFDKFISVRKRQPQWSIWPISLPDTNYFFLYPLLSKRNCFQLSASN